MAGRGRGRGKRGAPESGGIVPGIPVISGNEPGPTQGPRKIPRPEAAESVVDPQGGSGTSGQHAQLQITGGGSSGQYEQLQPSLFIDDRLMVFYGGLEPEDREILEFFFKLNTQCGTEALAKGLRKFTYSLQVAVGNHSVVLRRMTEAEHALNAVLGAKLLVENELRDVKSEVLNLQVCFVFSNQRIPFVNIQSPTEQCCRAHGRECWIERRNRKC
jgi:hypothetical protein